MRSPSALWAVVFAATAIAQSPPVARELPSRDLVVTFVNRSFDLDGLERAIDARDALAVEREVSGLAAAVRADQRGFTEAVERAGGSVRRQFWLINAAAISVPDSAVEAIATWPNVARVFDDAPRMPGAAPIRVSTNGQNHRTDDVQAQGVRGAGVGVAVLDTSLDSSAGALGRPHRTFFREGNVANTNDGGIGGSRLLANVQVGFQPADSVLDHGTKVAAVAIGGVWGTPAADHGHAPHAKVVGYSLADTPQGYTLLSTMVQAWQNVVADRVRYGIEVANLSYNGIYDLNYPDEQAMDAAASIGDVLIAAMAGNDAALPASYHGAVNVVAVGAVDADVHTVASFSARGPLEPATRPRMYPHMVANGVQLVVPTVDNEIVDTSGNGTSYSAPQVAGAAALFRSLATGATAEQTRAALLATTADVSSQNPGAIHAIGHGYLRVDRLVELANGAGAIAGGSVDTASPARRFSWPVRAGRQYVTAVSWSRRSSAATAWANLDLFVSQSGAALGATSGVWETNERVAFRAGATGTVDVDVLARRFEPGTASQDFGIVLYEVDRGGSLASYGASCAGLPSGFNVHAVVPFVTGFGSGGSDQLLGNVHHRIQHLFPQPIVPASFNSPGLVLRHDDAATPNNTRYWVEVEIDLGTTMLQPSAMSTNFDQNRGRIANNVVRRRKVVLPAQSAPNTSPSNWSIVIPFDQAFHYSFDFGGNLLVEVRKYDSSIGATSVPYVLDADAGATLFAANPLATTGTLGNGPATVIGLLDDLGNVVAPLLNGIGRPTIGSSYTIVLTQGPPNASAAFNLGLSNAAIGGFPLPLSLEPLGARGCFLVASNEASVTRTTNTAGLSSLMVAVPALASLVDAQVFHQGLVLDPSANALGVTTTNGVAGVIGR